MNPEFRLGRDRENGRGEGRLVMGLVVVLLGVLFLLDNMGLVRVYNFWEFWPRRFRITYNGKVLTADLWPRILSLAKHTSNSIRLNFQLG